MTGNGELSNLYKSVFDFLGVVGGLTFVIGAKGAAGVSCVEGRNLAFLGVVVSVNILALEARSSS